MWRIIRDVLEEKTVDIQSVDYEEGSELPYKFRLYDDDDNLYFEGSSDDRDSEAGFDPLDDYGMPDSGCTYIQYLQDDGSWETL